MFQVRCLFSLTLLHWVLAAPQLNLYSTHSVSENGRENILQHDCLRVAAYIRRRDDDVYMREIILYCMSELPPIVYVGSNDFISTFTFADLSKQNISSHQLYLWSAPIDIIEYYQFYLNQLSTSNDSSLAKQIFYNCTLPRFGPKCQYEFDHFHPNHSSLYDVIHDFYDTFEYNPTNLTCYIHLQCNRGALSACLDWTEICNGQIDCLDGGVDEEHCWQLEINECKKDEYRCKNGQCIPKLFFQDDSLDSDCLDESDGLRIPDYERKCHKTEPLFRCEESTCRTTPLTSSCMTKQQNLLLDIIYSIKDNSTSEQCWSTSKCILKTTNSEETFCENLCATNACINIILSTCPEFLYIPNIPVLFGHIYFAYRKSDLQQYLTTGHIWLLYVCYTTSLYDTFFNMVSKILLDHRSCYLYETISYSTIQFNLWGSIHQKSLERLYKELKQYHLMYNYTLTICNRSNMYQCMNSSKCISIHRLLNGVHDCPYMDDENITVFNNTNIMEQVKQTHYKCQISNKYISQSSLRNARCDCGVSEIGWCEDEESNYFYSPRGILFQTTCDGFTELLPKIIDGRNETDETECEQWQCNNIYTHCDGIWHCLNGADEIDCDSSSSLSSNCSPNHHLCVSPDTNQLICLSIEKANDGHIDCLGAMDEVTLCRQQYRVAQEDTFFCRNSTLQSCFSMLDLCDVYVHCEHGDDEQFCEKNRILPIPATICALEYSPLRSDVENLLCHQADFHIKQARIFFKLHVMNMSIKYQTKNIENTALLSSSNVQISDRHQSRCHRGLDLRIWLNDKNNTTNKTCLCSPSYYGDQCQYQNQRISLTLQFRALSDSYRTPLAIVISLTDDSKERIIHSHEHITYLSTQHCKTKFNLYLLYSTRPKDPAKQYAIHIDIYEKISLVYRGSVLLPVKLPFLPVHRLVFIVDIPRSDDKTQSCSNDQCIHGKCIKYSNNRENRTFCQCVQGWSGQHCTISHINFCASDSFHIGVGANNRSVCVCPLYKFGPRCLLTYTICQTNNNNNSLCQNNGQCIPNDDDFVSNRTFVCNCLKDFRGEQCEITNNKLVLSFDKDIPASQSIFIHFIQVIVKDEPARATTFKITLLRQDSSTIYWSRPFHLVFIELVVNKHYYLAVLQTTYNQSTTIDKLITPSDRCPNISEVLNETVVQWNLIRRIKYYHLPCQNQSLNLSCFHDDVQLCLCYTFQQQRLANCFSFDHNMTFDCRGQNECENGGQCLQDSPDCSARSMCICPPCSYGRRCQLSTSGFGLSLDAILGYHILPGVGVTQQPIIVQFSLVLMLLFFLAGLINGLFCLMTFKNKSVREVGCGSYLLGSSITTLLTMMMFALKFLILLLAQMGIISNRSFLSFQCHSMDFILRVCLCLDQWLNACVACERACTAVKKANFIKKESKKAAKFVIIILLIIVVSSCIHDPISRRLIDEENDDDEAEKRTWCVVNYSSSLEVYNYIMHIFHFFGPFLINLISAIILIKSQSEQQAVVHEQRPYKEHLREQFRQHRHLLTAPVVLVVLAVPRLIITFVSKCMKSPSDAWLFLVGYFISFVPPMLTYLIFVSPSKFYKKEFHNSLQKFRTTIQRRLGMTS